MSEGRSRCCPERREAERSAEGFEEREELGTSLGGLPTQGAKRGLPVRASTGLLSAASRSAASLASTRARRASRRRATAGGFSLLPLPSPAGAAAGALSAVGAPRAA